MSEETILFDVPCCSNTGKKVAKSTFGIAAGRLILTDRRIAFLSSGKSGTLKTMAKAFFVGSTAAVLARDNMERKLAESLDWSALENKGSWELPLNQVEEISSGGSGFGALFIVALEPHVRIAGTSEGTPVSWCVSRGEVKGHIKEVEEFLRESVRKGAEN